MMIQRCITIRWYGPLNQDQMVQVLTFKNWVHNDNTKSEHEPSILDPMVDISYGVSLREYGQSRIMHN